MTRRPVAQQVRSWTPMPALAPCRPPAVSCPCCAPRRRAGFTRRPISLAGDHHGVSAAPSPSLPVLLACSSSFRCMLLLKPQAGLYCVVASQAGGQPLRRRRLHGEDPFSAGLSFQTAEGALAKDSEHPCMLQSRSPTLPWSFRTDSLQYCTVEIKAVGLIRMWLCGRSILQQR